MMNWSVLEVSEDARILVAVWVCLLPSANFIPDVFAPGDVFADAVVVELPVVVVWDVDAVDGANIPETYSATHC